MSIVIRRWGPGDKYAPEERTIHIYVTGDSVKNFRDMVFRAMNTWDTAPPELKIFADELIHGKALQDYSSQQPHIPLKGTMKS